MAVDARGNVLVTAGAGTGKTLTLAARCCSLVGDHGVPLERILIVTFTEAAAAEMRQRIRLLLESRREQDLENLHLAEQLALLDYSPISTLHSFCLRLLREHFHELGLDPQFSVLSQELLQPVIRETLERVLTPYLEGDLVDSQSFQQVFFHYGQGDPLIIHELLLRIHRYAQSLPHPEQWYEQNLVLYQQPEPSLWRKWFHTGFEAWRQEWISEMSRGSAEHDLSARYASELSALPSRPDLAQLRPALEKILRLNSDQASSGKIPQQRKVLKTFLSETEFWLSLTPSPDASPLEEDWHLVRSSMSLLLRMARDFGAAYTTAKQDLGGLDFSDLEQYALRLLWDFTHEQPTDLAEMWRQQFEFVFVDEYQDINAVQDAILRALSRPDAHANRFLVGDVKQSIYRFRLSDPRIFRQCIDAWQNQPGKSVVIPLQDNFRSHPSILDFVNALFRTVMRPEATGVAFAKHDELLPGNPLPPPPGSSGIGPRAELHLLQATDDSEAGDDMESDAPTAPSVSVVMEVQKSEREARLVAHLLHRLKKEQRPIWDQDHYRPVDWRDMAILVRSPKALADAFVKEFALARIPLHTHKDGFLDSPEVTDLLNLLRLLDNPMQDLPLLAVLRSPLVALTLDELAWLRIYDPANSWWMVIRRFHRNLPEAQFQIQGQQAMVRQARALWEKMDLFLRHYDSWRQQARQASLVDCLQQILVDTGYESILEAQPDAANKLANLNRLLGRVRQFDPFQRQGLSRFLTYLEAQPEVEEPRSTSLPAQTNAVRLLSIHKSKGLEFPVVVVAGLDRAFNLQDLQSSIILDEALGLCPRIFVARDNGRIAYPSLPNWLARKRQKKEILAEEMRLLYVAVTRAREILLLTGSTRKASAIPPWRIEEPGSDLTTRQILGAKSYLDWITLWLHQTTSASDWTGQRTGQNRTLRWCLHELPAEPGLLIADTDSPGVAPAQSPPQGLAGFDELKRRALWQYPFVGATAVPAKTSISVLRHHADDSASEAAVPAVFLPWLERNKPGDASSPLDAVEKGIAHHTFLEWISIEKTATRGLLEEEATRLENAGVLTPAEHASLDWEALEDFWTSALGRRIAAQARHVQRELAFTARFTAEELAGVGIDIGHPLVPEDFIVIQGVADLVVLLPDEIWLLDYKTDALRKEDLDLRVRFHSPQLLTYARALENIYRRRVTEIWLCFLMAKENVRIHPLGN
jgi:ATP-dependent helicase/nuclease subunit A